MNYAEHKTLVINISEMFIKRDHNKSRNCYQRINRNDQHSGNKKNQQTTVKVVGEDYHGTFPGVILPKEIIVYDKKIDDFKKEIGKIYRSKRVHEALSEMVDTRLNHINTEKVQLNNAIGGSIQLKDVKITCTKHSNNRIEIDGKFLKRNITRVTSRRIETIILLFSKLESNDSHERKRIYSGLTTVIEEDLIPSWETKMILKKKVKVVDVIDHIDDLVVENFILDIRIQDFKIEKEVFTAIHYKAIPRKKLNLATVTRMGRSDPNSLRTTGFQIINHVRSVPIFSNI